MHLWIMLYNVYILYIIIILSIYNCLKKGLTFIYMLYNQQGFFLRNTPLYINYSSYLYHLFIKHNVVMLYMYTYMYAYTYMYTYTKYYG